VSKGRTFPTGVGAPILLEGMQVIGRVRPSPHPQVSSIAQALGCSVADLTGQPYLAPDRATFARSVGFMASPPEVGNDAPTWLIFGEDHSN
jgi:hypothetical protein